MRRIGLHLRELGDSSFMLWPSSTKCHEEKASDVSYRDLIILNISPSPRRDCPVHSGEPSWPSQASGATAGEQGPVRVLQKHVPNVLLSNPTCPQDCKPAKPDCSGLGADGFEYLQLNLERATTLGHLENRTTFPHKMSSHHKKVNLEDVRASLNTGQVRPSGFSLPRCLASPRLVQGVLV